MLYLTVVRLSSQLTQKLIEQISHESQGFSILYTECHNLFYVLSKTDSLFLYALCVIQISLYAVINFCRLHLHRIISNIREVSTGMWSNAVPFSLVLLLYIILQCKCLYYINMQISGWLEIVVILGVISQCLVL